MTTAKPLKPCGTAAAYHRHLRQKELPCDDCLKAWRDYNRDRKRERDRRLRKEQNDKNREAAARVLANMDERDDGTRLGDLKDQRKLVKAVLVALADTEPSKVASVSRELREINLEIEKLSQTEDKAEGALNKFFDGIKTGGGLAVVSDVHTA